MQTRGGKEAKIEEISSCDERLYTCSGSVAMLQTRNFLFGQVWMFRV